MEMRTDLRNLDRQGLIRFVEELGQPAFRGRQMMPWLYRPGITDIEEMDRSIGQFLDFARTDGGEPPEEIEMAALLEEIAGQYGRRGNEITAVTGGVSPRLTLRPKAIRRALGNLIDNALRHAGADQPIELALLVQDGKCAIEVRDRGPGIPPDEVERLKLPFTQMQSARTGAIGTGLGLAIVDRIARSQGGQLDLLPRDGGGLVARITLPIR